MWIVSFYSSNFNLFEILILIDANLSDTKRTLLNEVSNFFEDSQNDSEDHFAFNANSINQNLLIDKIEDKNLMKKIADMLIKHENYDGANKIYDHIEILSKIQKLSEEKNVAVSEEQYDTAKILKNEITELRLQLMSPEAVMDVYNTSTDDKHLTLRSILELIIKRLDEPFSVYFIPNVIERYNKFEDINIQQLKRESSVERKAHTNPKIQFKAEVMIQSLVLFKISAVGLENYKKNWELIVPFLLKEIEENNRALSEMKNYGEDALDIIREDQKFTVFLKGIKALYQVVTNIHTSLDQISKIKTRFSNDFEQYLNLIKQCLIFMKKMISILDSDIGICSKLLDPQLMNNKIIADETAIEDGLSAIHKHRYNNMCSLWATYILNGDSDKEKEELHLPERRLVFNNHNEEQQTYHNYWINLWINNINSNPY